MNNNRGKKHKSNSKELQIQASGHVPRKLKEMKQRR